MHVADVFRRAYEQLNARVYAGALPPWPGARVEDTFDVITAVNAWKGPRGEVRRLGPFTISAHVRDAALLREAFRHETAHVGAMVLDAHWDHGRPWQRHARACGAAPGATRDDVPWATGLPPRSAGRPLVDAEGPEPVRDATRRAADERVRALHPHA